MNGQKHTFRSSLRSYHHNSGICKVLEDWINVAIFCIAPFRHQSEVAPDYTKNTIKSSGLSGLSY